MNTIRSHHDRARLHSFSLCICFAVLLLAGSASAFAQKAAPIDINLDPAATSIHWTLNTTVHTVHGTFKLKNGSFRIDPTSGDASGQIVIDATSGESGDSPRDNRMQGFVLESPKYPTITFRPTHVVGKVDLSAPGPVTVDGFLNLHGQDHPLQITVNLHPQATAVALAAHFAVPYVAWGLKDPSTFIFRADKQVMLDVDATAIPGPDSSARAAAGSIARPILHPSEVHSAR
jgi:polyisoprenoid-binding protein YceI